MDEEDLGESLPLTGVGAMFIDEAVRALSELTISPCHTLEDVHALLKQVIFPAIQRFREEQI